MKKCPYCKKELVDTALRCRFCRRVLSPAGIADESALIINNNPELVRLSIISAILTAPFMIIFVFYSAFNFHSRLGYLNIVLVVYFIGLIANFFSAAIVAYILKPGAGRSDIAAGIKTAFSKIDTLMLWTLVSLTVGLLLGVLERLLRLAKFVTTAGMISYSAATFFVLPLIVTRDMSIIEAIRVSARMVKNNPVKAFGGLFKIDLKYMAITGAITILGILVLAWLADFLMSERMLSNAWLNHLCGFWGAYSVEITVSLGSLAIASMAIGLSYFSCLTQIYRALSYASLSKQGI